jgi:hypothetical protein
VARNGRRTSIVSPQSDYGLDDFFVQEELEDVINTARRRVIGTFHHSTELHRGRVKGTDNYIRGVEPKMTELARHVLQKMKSSFIRPGQLEELIDTREMPRRDLERLIHQLQFDAVMLALHIMCVQPPKTPPGFRIEDTTDEIYYDSVLCVWQIRQSSIDEYRLIRAVARKIKRDNRNFHGRNRSQSQRRGVPEGTSISIA